MSAGDAQSVIAAAEAAVREYELSRDRYIHAVRSDAEAKVMKSVASRREKLTDELKNLMALARARADARTEAVKTYGQRCPGRVTPTSLLPPTSADRIANFGVDKLFKNAVKAAEDLKEVNDLILKRRESLEQIDQEMRTVLAQHNEELIRFLESPDGLANAFKRDPLLGQAHARMKAALARRDALGPAPPTPPETAAP